MRKLFTVVTCCLLMAAGTQAQVVINEYSCSNLSQFTDNFSKYEDWVELYNTSSSSVNLGGYYLSDDSLNNQKWTIPAGTTIAGNGFLRFWASGRNLVSGSHYHTSFKFNQTKNSYEFIVLSDPSGVRLDYVNFINKTQLGHSWGRVPNGGSVWKVFTSPSINASNNSATSYTHYADKPDVTSAAGYYTSAFGVALSTTEPNSVIRYTLDGTLPTASSPAYLNPIVISATTVLKARTFSYDTNVLPSFVRYETYFINVSHTLPVVSISGNQLNTLANGNQSLTPHGTFEYFNVNQVRSAKTYGEFNSHGQDSWVLSQRSLDFISRDEMGYNHSIEEKMFNLTNRSKFQRVILRAAGDDNYPADYNSANAGSAHLRDAYVHNLTKKGGMALDVRTATKCVVYLNGVYWGVYDLREKVDDPDFTDYYYGQNKYNIQFIMTWGNTWVEYGGPQALTDWTALRNYILNNNMATTSNYQYVYDRLDVNSLVDYILANSFTVCSDWLNYNTGWWRGLDSTGTHKKWGYIMWDNDATFGHYINYTGIPNTTASAQPCDPQTLTWSQHIQILNKLRSNPDFNQFYISRQIDMWNTVFSCSNMLSQLDSIAAVIDPEMTQHSTRWNGTYSGWQTNVLQMRNFIAQRCTSLAGGLLGCYNLSGPHLLVIDRDLAGAGSVKLNSLTINQFPFTGVYFGGVDTKLQALPQTNYVFNHWSSNAQTFNPVDTALQVRINLASADTIIAHFNFLTTGIVNTEVQPTPVISAQPSVFDNTSTIQYYLPQQVPVSLKLYSIMGTEVATLVPSGKLTQPGTYSVEINLSGSNLKPGMYFVDFVAGNYRQTVKMIYAPK